MIKVSVMYPNKAGARFNHDYYRDKQGGFWVVTYAGEIVGMFGLEAVSPGQALRRLETGR